MKGSRYFGAVLAASALLGGCSSLSGLDASSSFSCKAAPGVTCQSISGVYQNASAGNLPFQRNGDPNVNASAADGNGEASQHQPTYGTVKSDVQTKVSPREMAAAYSGMSVRQPPLVLRVWMAPYEDDTGDLHDQSYFYTMVHSGRWMIEANRNAITSQFRPVYPLNRQARSEESSPNAEEKQPIGQKGEYNAVDRGEYNRLVEKPGMN